MMGSFSEELAELKSDFRKYNEEVFTNVGKVIQQSCIDLEAHTKEVLSRGRDEPSIDGEPPRVDTGRLRASITHRIKTEENDVVGEVGTNVDYAVDLEFGTSRTWTHPFLGPTFDKMEPWINAEIDKAMEEAEKGAKFDA